jgi:prepilin-type N-terminal cleavage/methylation domain-containing protein
MKNRISRGFTLIELIIVMSILGFIVALAGFIFKSCSSSRNTAEEEARVYASKMGMTLKGVSCMNRDTDDDGYVSCTLNVIEKDGKENSIPIECAAKWSYNNDGCREAILGGFRRGR